MKSTNKMVRALTGVAIVLGGGLGIAAMLSWSAPTVTAEHRGDVYIRYNRDRHCSPLSDSLFFTSYEDITVVMARSSKCALCGRAYRNHYKKVYTSQKWRAKVRSARNRKEYMEYVNR